MICDYAECRYAESSFFYEYAECHYAERRGANVWSLLDEEKKFWNFVNRFLVLLVATILSLFCCQILSIKWTFDDQANRPYKTF